MALELKVITTTLPSYLKSLLREDSSVKLVYRGLADNAVNQVKLEAPNKVADLDTADLSEMSALELTGTPLEVDLGKDDSVEVVLDITERPPSWTAAEAKHNPITLHEARDFINSQLKNNNPNKQIKQKHIYCVCDGKDPKQTIVLGACADENKFVRTMVYRWPCDETDENLLLASMKQQHLKNIEDGEIKCVQYKCFYLYGYDLTNHSHLQTAQHNGSISVEVCTHGTVNDNKNNPDLKMNLQVAVGHNNSAINSYWQEICLLRSFVEILGHNKQLHESTKLSTNCLNSSEVISGIIDLLQNVNCYKKANPKELDLQKPRQENTLDKLWNLIKRCRDVGDLRDSFHAFFEELVQLQTRIQNLNEDNSTFGEIANGIADGKIAVPTLSFSQSLEFLIELGLEKLKKDYTSIINRFYPLAQESVMKHWRNLCANMSNSNKPENRAAKRQTKRISANLKSTVIDLSASNRKLSLLEAMHTVAEFIFLYKENMSLSEENFDYLCENLCGKYISNFPVLNVAPQWKNCTLSSFSVGLLPMDYVAVKDKHPISWTVNMSSSVDLSEVTTIFHFSHYPVFPPTIWDNSDAANYDDLDLKWNVAKLVRFVDNF